MKVKCTRGFGIVEHPETGEEINVEDPFETDQETFKLLNNEYPGFEVVDDSDGGEPGESEDTDGEPQAVCGEEMTDGSICERPAGECPYH